MVTLVFKKSSFITFYMGVKWSCMMQNSSVFVLIKSLYFFSHYYLKGESSQKEGRGREENGKRAREGMNCLPPLRWWTKSKKICVTKVKWDLWVNAFLYMEAEKYILSETPNSRKVDTNWNNNFSMQLKPLIYLNHNSWLKDKNEAIFMHFIKMLSLLYILVMLLFCRRESE